MKSCESARFFNTSLPGKVPTVAVLRFSAEPQPFAHSPQLFAHSGARGLLRRNYWNSAGRAPSPGLSLPWKLKRVGTTTVVVVRCTSDFLRMPKEPNPICIFLLFPPQALTIEFFVFLAAIDGTFVLFLIFIKSHAISRGARK